MKWVILAVVILIIGSSVVLYAKRPSKSSYPSPAAPVLIDKGGLPLHGEYISYPGNFNAASNKKRVLFFHAPWCPTCKIANSELESKKGEIPADVIVYKTDYDSEKKLKAKYDITYQHTFVLVDANGNEIKKWNGGGISELITNTK